MPIEYKKNKVIFRDMVSVEEAEALLGWLQDKSAPKIHLGQCTHLHPANLQVLMAARAKVASWPEDASLKQWLSAALQS